METLRSARSASRNHSMYQNNGQQLAIDTVEGQLLVIAGPGSGKTTTMLAHIHHMVEEHI